MGHRYPNRVWCVEGWLHLLEAQPRIGEGTCCDADEVMAGGCGQSVMGDCGQQGVAPFAGPPLPGLSLVVDIWGAKGWETESQLGKVVLRSLCKSWLIESAF